MSLVELVVTMAILGFLIAIAVPRFGGVIDHSRRVLTSDAMALLNRGVASYNQSAEKIPVAAASGAADELEVLALLTTRDESIPGSPYVPAEFSTTTSSATDTFRMTWSGDFFTLTPPGTSGAGLVIEN